MAERKFITLVYKYNENWIGGTYYIINIIKSLMYLDDADRPMVSICYEGSLESINEIKKIGYPYITYVKIENFYNYVIKVVNAITDKLFHQRWLVKKIPQKQISNLYPASVQWSFKNVKNLYFWIPDFQEKHLPHFFSDLEIKKRNEYQLKIKNTNLPIVFSSYTALRDYDRFYPDNTNKKEVLQFVSIIDDDYLSLDIDALKGKFNITQPYFITSNQFWKHKNHLVVIKAIELLLAKGITSFQVIFTGKEYDFRNPQYTQELKTYIKSHNLDEHIRFLGFIGRDEQLRLMKCSLSIIQPSLFEGWSTVVEDAKALNHYIILSDISLHKEQIENNCSFFDPYKPEDLAEKMEDIINHAPVADIRPYESYIRDFARKFVSLIN